MKNIKINTISNSKFKHYFLLLSSCFFLLTFCGEMKTEEAREWAKQKEAELGIPAVLPLEDGLDRLVPLFRDMIEKSIAQV